MDALDEEEEEELLKVEIPEWRSHFRNLEWRVRALVLVFLYWCLWGWHRAWKPAVRTRTQNTHNLSKQVLVNVARSLGTKTIHYTLLDPLLAMYLSTRAMDRLTKVRLLIVTYIYIYLYLCISMYV